MVPQLPLIKTLIVAYVLLAGHHRSDDEAPAKSTKKYYQMVIISTSVISKAGKPLVARQYRDISRVRLEGLLSAFPKLMDPKSQHTFVETDSVRYVYQALDQLFLVMITTKTSNIVEDLETLQLFSRIVGI